MISLSDKERAAIIVVATLALIGDLLHFPAVAHDTTMAAAQSQLVSSAPIPSVAPVPSPLTPRDYSAIALANPYGQDNSNPVPSHTDGSSNLGDKQRMGDITNANNPFSRGDGLADLGHGDSTALVRVGTNEAVVVHVGDVVAGHHIASISVSDGVRLDDGTVLPAASTRTADGSSVNVQPSPAPAATTPPPLLPIPLPPGTRPAGAAPQIPLTPQQLRYQYLRGLGQSPPPIGSPSP